LLQKVQTSAPEELVCNGQTPALLTADVFYGRLLTRLLHASWHIWQVYSLRSITQVNGKS